MGSTNYESVPIYEFTNAFCLPGPFLSSQTEIWDPQYRSISDDAATSWIPHHDVREDKIIDRLYTHSLLEADGKTAVSREIGDDSVMVVTPLILRFAGRAALDFLTKIKV